MSENKKLKFEFAKNKAKHILAGAALVVGLNVSGFQLKNAANIKNSEKKELLDKKKIQSSAKKVSLNKKYKIKSRADFDKLWNDAKPFCVPVLTLSENWRPDWHNDKQQKSAPNSVAVGLYFFPKNGDFKSKDWETTCDYYKKYKVKHGKAPSKLTPRQIRDGIYGYGESFKDGLVITDLFNALNGCELTINEFAAVYSHYYHVGNLKAVKKIAGILKKPQVKDKTLECAKVLIDTDPIIVGGKAYNGRKSRFMHEALVFLNEDNYCNDLYWLRVDCNLGTSINACPGEFKNVNNGKLTHKKAQTIKIKICNFPVKNGKTIKELCESIKDNSIMNFCVANANTAQMESRDDSYNRAVAAYNKQDYKTAKYLFEEVIAKHGEGADLWNNLSITYFNLGEYDKCIEMCEKVLNSDKSNEYAKAAYNSGKAYEKKQDYKNALKCYENAEYYFKKYGIADQAPNVNYGKIYKNAISRTKQMVKSDEKVKPDSQKLQSTSKTASGKSQNSSKAKKFRNAKIPQQNKKPIPNHSRTR